MKVLQEGNLSVSIDGELQAWKFNGPSHGLSHCMKAVDLIVEFPSHYLFLEFKDPQHPEATSQSREKFIHEFMGGSLDEDLKYKYRDSFLYEWASGRANKPVHYFVLIADDALTDAELIARTDALARILPLKGPESGSWTRKIVESCVVFNIESWNRTMSQYPINRLPLTTPR